MVSRKVRFYIGVIVGYALFVLCPAHAKTVHIGVIHSGYELGGYNPATVWDKPIRKLGWKVDKLPSKKMEQWSKHLDNYDVLLFANLYTHGQKVFWNDLGVRIRHWLKNGGLAIVEGASSDASVGWLRNIRANWRFRVGRTLSGLPEWVDSEFLNPHKLTDGWRVYGWYVGRIPQPCAPDFSHNGLITPVLCGKVLARNRKGKAIIWTDHLGNGTVFVTTLFNGYGLDEYVLENMLAYHYKHKGISYAQVLKEPLPIKERIANYPIPKSSSPFIVRFTDYGIMRIDGKLFFPFGFYCVRRKDSLKIMKEKGFNFSYGISDGSVKNLSGLSWDNRKIAEQIERNISKLSLVAWEILEEPSNTHFDNLWCLFRSALVHKLDPSRPVGILLNNPATFDGYGRTADFIVADPYCIHSDDSDLTRIAGDIQHLQDLFPEKPVWVCLQAHRFLHHLTIPTPQQLRGEMYVALAAGAKGIVWFALDDDGNKTISFIRYKDGHFQQPQWDTLCRLAREFRRLEPWLVAPDTIIKAEVLKPKVGVYVRCWTGQDSHLLIVANALSEPTEVILKTTLGKKEYQSLFNSPELKCISHMIKLKLKGYASGIYKFDK